MTNCDTIHITKIFEAITNELINFVNWAKSLSEFNSLSKKDQANLVYAHAGRHLILSVSRRSLNHKNSLLLNNGYVLTNTMSFAIIEMKLIIEKILNELINDMRELQMDDTEITNLNGMSFFDPYASCDLSSAREYIKTTRNVISESLKNYTIQQKHDSIIYPIRFTKIVLMLPLLEKLGSIVYNSILNANPFGVSIEIILYNLLNQNYVGYGNIIKNNAVKMTTPIVAIELNDQEVAELWNTLANDVDANGLHDGEEWFGE